MMGRSIESTDELSIASIFKICNVTNFLNDLGKHKPAKMDDF